MKIYYASQSFYPHIGGVSTYLLNLAKEMRDKGNDVVEVHLRPSGEGNVDEIKGIEVHRVPKEPIDEDIMKEYSFFKEAIYKECHDNKGEFNKPAYKLRGYEEYNKVNEYFGEQILELLEKNPADIVHIHDFQLLFAYKYVPRGMPLILTWHIPIIEDISKHLAKFLIKHMKEYDKVVFSSKEYIDAFVKHGFPKEKAVLIHPIANTSLFCKKKTDVNEVRRKYGIPEGKVIMSVQRIDPKSGHEQLIKAMPKIIEKVEDARLVFVGGESMSNKLSKSRAMLAEGVKNLVKKLGLENHVFFTGNIDYNELPLVYNSVDMVALCSKNEGFGLSVTEAMACARPIVGTKVGGIPLQVKNGENGFLVDVGDVKDTAEKILKILEDTELQKKFSKKSLEIVETNFKMEVGIEKHLELYNTVLKQKNEFHRVEYIDISEVKGIITDLDRTITDEPAKANFDKGDFDKALFEEMKKSGVDLFLSTGRVFDFVKKLSDEFGLWRGIIAENGAVIYFANTKKKIIIDTEFMKRARKIIREMNLPDTTIGDVITSNRLEDFEKIKKELGELCENLNFVKNVNEIMTVPKFVDKGTGIKMMMGHLGIDMDKTIIIGDGENDVDMFLNPGFKIALANAHKKLKKLANQVTKERSTKGIREIFEKLKR